MTEICGYEYIDDYEDQNGYACQLRKGHRGKHHYRVALEWETRPFDICKEKGHVWGEWFPYEEPMRQDISDVLMASLMGGGRLEVIEKPTKERRCTRCGAHDNNGVTKWHRGTLEANLLGAIQVGPEFITPAMTWADDKLNPSDEP